MARLFSERAFLPNFLGKLPGGYERLEIADAGAEAILTQKPYAGDEAHSKLLQEQRLEEFYGAIDNTYRKLNIPESEIMRAHTEYRNGNFHEVRVILFPLIKSLHGQGYNIVDLSGKHMIPKKERAKT